MIVTENGYINPHESEFEPVESENFEYTVDFIDCQYFLISAWWSGNKLMFNSVELKDWNNKVLMKFDPDYLDDLILEKWINKIYDAAYEYSYLK